MIRRATAESVVVGAHVLKEGATIIGYVGYAGVVTRVNGMRVYHQRTIYRAGQVDEVEPERWSHLKTIFFVADTQDAAEQFKGWYNNSLTELHLKADSFRAQLTSAHLAKVEARLVGAA